MKLLLLLVAVVAAQREQGETIIGENDPYAYDPY